MKIYKLKNLCIPVKLSINTLLFWGILWESQATFELSSANTVNIYLCTVRVNYEEQMKKWPIYFTICNGEF